MHRTASQPDGWQHFCQGSGRTRSMMYRPKSQSDYSKSVLLRVSHNSNSLFRHCLKSEQGVEEKSLMGSRQERKLPGHVPKCLTVCPRSWNLMDSILQSVGHPMRSRRNCNTGRSTRRLSSDAVALGDGRVVREGTSPSKINVSPCRDSATWTHRLHPKPRN